MLDVHFIDDAMGVALVHHWGCAGQRSHTLVGAYGVSVTVGVEVAGGLGWLV